MAVAERTLQILPGGQGAAPFSYVLPASTSFTLLGVRAVFDGTSATGSFLPSVQIVSDSGVTMFQAIAQLVAAGAGADVSFGSDQAANVASSAGVSSIVTATAGGATQIVAAQAGLFTRVLKVGLMADAAVGVKFTDGTSDLTGTFPLAANTGFVLGADTVGWFTTKAANRPVDISLSVNANVGGVLVWETVTNP